MFERILPLLIFISTLLFAEQKVLVLHSYHHGLEWSDNISKGIIETLNKSPEKVTIHFEYLDAKRYFTPYFKEKTFEYLLAKHGKTRYDAIIACDNDALAFINQNNALLFSNTPIIFCGINDFMPEFISNIKEVTGVKEAVDYIGTISLSLELFPKRKKILIFVDDTVTGQKIYHELQESQKEFLNKVTFYNYADFSPSELVEFLKKYQDEISTYFLTYNRDKQGNFYDYAESMALVKNMVGGSIPIFGSWDFVLGKGIVGGVITLGFEQGKSAAQLTLKVLSGQPAHAIPILAASNTMETIIDMEQANHFKLSKFLLPTSVNYINESLDFWVKYKKELIYFGITFFFLCLLSFMFFRRNIIYLKNVTEEVTYIAASIAELKSKETAQHLRRVSHISYLLAKYLGIQNKTCEMIKMASMLHDIGKVGIPDVILNKPGALDKDEWKIMQTHTTLGLKMLSHSKLEFMRLASVIALEHHEKWDGTGYPSGKAGESIALVGRICAIADVFDSLLDKRVYKEPWSEERTRKYFESMSGKQFDPKITAILLKHFHKFVTIREALAVEPDRYTK